MSNKSKKSTNPNKNKNTVKANGHNKILNISKNNHENTSNSTSNHKEPQKSSLYNSPSRITSSPSLSTTSSSSSSSSSSMPSISFNQNAISSTSSNNALQAALLQAAAAAASQFPYNIKQYLEDPRNFNQFYNPFTPLTSIGNQNNGSSSSSSSSPSSMSYHFQNENSNLWSRPLESLYAAALAAAATQNNTNNSNNVPSSISLPAIPPHSSNNQFSLLSNAGANMNLNNGFFLGQLATSPSLSNLISTPNLNMEMKSKVNLHEMTVQALAAAQHQQNQQFLYHPYSNQIQQYQLQHNQQTK
jgi:hypothetical protein